MALSWVELEHSMDELRHKPGGLAARVRLGAAHHVHSPGMKDSEGLLYVLRTKAAGDDDRLAQFPNFRNRVTPPKRCACSSALGSGRAVNQPRVRVRLQRFMQRGGRNRLQNLDTRQLSAKASNIIGIFVAVQLQSGELAEARSLNQSLKVFIHEHS